MRNVTSTTVKKTFEDVVEGVFPNLTGHLWLPKKLVRMFIIEKSLHL